MNVARLKIMAGIATHRRRRVSYLMIVITARPALIIRTTTPWTSIRTPVGTFSTTTLGTHIIITVTTAGTYIMTTAGTPILTASIRVRIYPRAMVYVRLSCADV